MSPIIITIPVFKSAFFVNCYILGCFETKEALIIDPGADSENEIKEILNSLTNNKLNAKFIINTHGHLDHIAGNAMLIKYLKIPLLIHHNDAPMLLDSEKNGSSFYGQSILSPAATTFVEDGNEIKIGNIKCQVLHTPGHTKGGISIYCEGHLFSGDTLFAGSIGRTDLPGGSLDEEMSSIHYKLFTLPDTTCVYPGHGPQTKIGIEKRTNPYF